MPNDEELKSETLRFSRLVYQFSNTNSDEDLTELGASLSAIIFGIINQSKKNDVNIDKIKGVFVRSILCAVSEG